MCKRKSEQAIKRESERASERARKQASRQGREQASEGVIKQARKMCVGGDYIITNELKIFQNLQHFDTLY